MVHRPWADAGLTLGNKKTVDMVVVAGSRPREKKGEARWVYEVSDRTQVLLETVV